MHYMLALVLCVHELLCWPYFSFELMGVACALYLLGHVVSALMSYSISV